MDSGFSRELDCPAVRNRAMTSGDVCGAGLKAPDFIYSTRLWSNCFFSGLLACSRSRSMLHMINFPFRQFVSNKLARRRLLAKLSTHSTRGVTSVYKLSMQRVFDSVVSRHHCQSVCPSVGKWANAGWAGSSSNPIVPACLEKCTGLQKTGTNFPSSPFNDS